MLNVSSEILCNSSQTCARHVLELTPSGPPKHWTRQPETPWQWRTDKPLNHIEKLANVSSEILQNNSQTCARHVLHWHLLNRLNAGLARRLLVAQTLLPWRAPPCLAGAGGLVNSSPSFLDGSFGSSSLGSFQSDQAWFEATWMTGLKTEMVLHDHLNLEKLCFRFWVLARAQYQTPGFTWMVHVALFDVEMLIWIWVKSKWPYAELYEHHPPVS